MSGGPTDRIDKVCGVIGWLLRLGKKKKMTQYTHTNPQPEYFLIDSQQLFRRSLPFLHTHIQPLLKQEGVSWVRADAELVCLWCGLGICVLILVHVWCVVCGR